MIENLVVVGKEQSYGYDSYYVRRKNESISFPTNSSIVKALSSSVGDYSVESRYLNIKTNVIGTLKSFSSTPYGYASKIAKHNVKLREVVFGTETEENYEYILSNAPVVTGTMRGSIFNEGKIIQTFKTEKGSTNLIFVEKGTPETKVMEGSYDLNDNGEQVVTLYWNNNPADSAITVSYEYEDPNLVQVLTPFAPIADNYNFINLYGQITVDVKYVKIASNFKCKYKNSAGGYSYTNTKSKAFSNKCRSFKSSCLSKNNANVTASTVCYQKLF